MLDTGYWMLDAGYWILDTGCWMLDPTFSIKNPASRIRESRIQHPASRIQHLATSIQQPYQLLFIMEILLSARVKKFLKETFFLGLFIAVIVFAWVRILFFEVPFSLWEDGLTLCKTVLTGWILMAAFKLLWHVLLQLAAALQPVLIRRPSSLRWVIVLVLSASLYACQAQPAAKGFSIDGSTGLKTRYTGMRPEETRMVMNGEVLNHTDIPLGEKFTIINEGIKGLTVKESKVSIGCSLLITDTAGKTILSELDLFAKNPEFDKDSIEYLQCKVNTGTPMEWDQLYTVKVIFWDKYGKGQIENTVRIRMIDEP
jgi:hypothetical protein